MGYSCRNPTSVYLFSLLFVSQFFALFSQAANNITQGQLVRDGETLLSSGQQNFVLGFFSPANSTSRYVGIWYNKVSEQTIIWVANRESPISGENGTLTVANDGNLLIYDGNGNSVWSTNASIASGNSTAILQDTGNFILTNGTNQVLWQTFEAPTDTFLPGMKAYANALIGENRPFSSWKSSNDPSPGNYSMGIDPRASPQIVVWEMKNRRWRSGHWDGQVFMGFGKMETLYSYGFKLTNEGDGNEYFTYTTLNTTNIVRFMIRWDGFGEQLIWDEQNKNWTALQKEPSEECDVYNKCGNFGLCTVGDSQICTCIEGFEAQYTDQWNNGNWSGGCVRRTSLQCDSNTNTSSDGFLAVKGVKLPDYADSVMVKNASECETNCLKNCSCIAYAYAYAYLDGVACMIWGGDLLDVERLEDGGGSIYVRLAHSNFEEKKRSTKVVITIAVIIGSVTIAIFILSWRWMARRRGRKKKSKKLLAKRGEVNPNCSNESILGENLNQNKLEELPLFSFKKLAIATDKFDAANKLGQGGFGPVYKGKLPSGQDIAVKRLSSSSGQGLEEFMNEVVVISQLQHRNLVKLIGCCVEGEEKMLIYEYMPNKSLDAFLFDPIKQKLLDWRKRVNIIEGIGRGLLYLHRDSRLRIIHRDLKTSNVLLDEDLNPKISDFGMAKIFGGNQDLANTRRVVGTYGYMAPEYAMQGRFSEKSDVFSFGVLLLEIVSGRKNTSFYHDEHSLSLLGFAWKLWNENRIIMLIDPTISDPCFQVEILRYIHVGLLCVQDFITERPTMSIVLSMLCSEIANLPTPKQPAFTEIHGFSKIGSSQQSQRRCSVNNVTVTTMDGR